MSASPPLKASALITAKKNCVYTGHKYGLCTVLASLQAYIDSIYIMVHNIIKEAVSLQVTLSGTMFVNYQLSNYFSRRRQNVNIKLSFASNQGSSQRKHSCHSVKSVFVKV